MCLRFFPAAGIFGNNGLNVVDVETSKSRLARGEVESMLA
jgi:hypothetical protein